MKSLEIFFSPKGGCTSQIVKYISKTKVSLDIQAFTFTSAPIAKAVLDVYKKGVPVRIILDSDEATSKYSSATFFTNMGIAIKIDKKHAIAHNKIIIIDQKRVITGSFNFTNQAETSNAENLLVINRPDIAKLYKDNFELHYGHSELYVQTESKVLK